MSRTELGTERPLFGAFLVWVLMCLVIVSPATAASGKQKPASQAVASAHPLATAAGMDMLRAGGNAFDAAVAITAVLAVVEPYSSGIGGGGFWLLHRASDGKQIMIDGRERAPLAARRDLYLDEQGEVLPRLSIDGALAAAIPGEPAALVHLGEKYGRLPLKESLAHAIKLAEEGFEVDAIYQRMAGFRQQVLRRYPSSAKIFMPAGEVPSQGTVIRQPELAHTLRSLASEGRRGFYAGDLAERLVAGVRAEGGIWTLEDLQQYQVVERDPLTFRYRDLRIVTVPPPSSGGVALATMLHILEGYDLPRLGEIDRAHLIIEAMRRAYRDRAQYLGDSDFVDVPLQRLMHPWYAAGLRASIRRDRATPSASLPGAVSSVEGADTSHFSVLDGEGNRVAATLSINYPFGSGYVVPGTGVLLNDEMDDFSAKPGVPNAYGLVGGEANAIAPGKRPLSSMSPTFVESDEGIAVLGTPGGSRIITMVLLGILDLEQGRQPQSWVSLPRFHHQFVPDVVQYEPHAFSQAAVEALEAMGHRLQALDSRYGNMQAIYWDTRNNRVAGASDPRGIGTAQVQ